MAKRGSNIYKRKDGRFEGRVPVGYNDSGKIKYLSLIHIFQNVRTFRCGDSDFAGVDYCNDYHFPQNSSGSRLSEYSLFAVDSICFVS